MKWLWALIIGWLGAFNPIQTPSPAPSPSPALLIFGQYRYQLAVIDDLSRLKLDSNLPEPLESGELKQKNGCARLFSAGFYDTANRHLGWFMVDRVELSPPQVNNFLNGFLSITADSAAIGPDPDLTAEFGVQSGPLLITDGREINLKIRDDQPRRRIVAAITQSNQLVFLVILAQKSDYAGPRLTDLPRLVKNLLPEVKEAVNLDGGSASAFVNDQVNLKEYSPIGGFFCYTEL